MLVQCVNMVLHHGGFSDPRFIGLSFAPLVLAAAGNGQATVVEELLLLATWLHKSDRCVLWEHTDALSAAAAGNHSLCVAAILGVASWTSHRDVWCQQEGERAWAQALVAAAHSKAVDSIQVLLQHRSVWQGEQQQWAATVRCALAHAAGGGSSEARALISGAGVHACDMCAVLAGCVEGRSATVQLLLGCTAGGAGVLPAQCVCPSPLLACADVVQLEGLKTGMQSMCPASAIALCIAAGRVRCSTQAGRAAGADEVQDKVQAMLLQQSSQLQLATVALVGAFAEVCRCSAPPVDPQLQALAAAAALWGTAVSTASGDDCKQHAAWLHLGPVVQAAVSVGNDLAVTAALRTLLSCASAERRTAGQQALRHSVQVLLGKCAHAGGSALQSFHVECAKSIACDDAGVAQAAQRLLAAATAEGDETTAEGAAATLEKLLPQWRTAEAADGGDAFGAAVLAAARAGMSSLLFALLEGSALAPPAPGSAAARAAAEGGSMLCWDTLQGLSGTCVLSTLHTLLPAAVSGAGAHGQGHPGQEQPGRGRGRGRGRGGRGMGGRGGVTRGRGSRGSRGGGTGSGGRGGAAGAWAAGVAASGAAQQQQGQGQPAPWEGDLIAASAHNDATLLQHLHNTAEVAQLDVCEQTVAACLRCACENDAQAALEYIVDGGMVPLVHRVPLLPPHQEHGTVVLPMEQAFIAACRQGSMSCVRFLLFECVDKRLLDLTRSTRPVGRGGATVGSLAMKAAVESGDLAIVHLLGEQTGSRECPIASGHAFELGAIMDAMQADDLRIEQYLRQRQGQRNCIYREMSLLSQVQPSKDLRAFRHILTNPFAPSCLQGSGVVVAQELNDHMVTLDPQILEVLLSPGDVPVHDAALQHALVMQGGTQQKAAALTALLRHGHIWPSVLNKAEQVALLAACLDDDWSCLWVLVDCLGAHAVDWRAASLQSVLEELAAVCITFPPHGVNALQLLLSWNGPTAPSPGAWRAVIERGRSLQRITLPYALDCKKQEAMYTVHPPEEDVCGDPASVVGEASALALVAATPATERSSSSDPAVAKARRLLLLAQRGRVLWTGNFMRQPRRAMLLWRAGQQLVTAGSG